jgi:glycosyltransferase involved in cell wall biosynthesis
MKILHIVNAYPPAWETGGPARIVYDISKELVKRGHIVTVYTTDILNSKSRLKNTKNPVCIDGVNVFHFKNLSNTLASKNIPIALGMMPALKLDVKNYDVIHAHLSRCFQSILVHHYAKKFEIPYILQPRGALPVTNKRKQKRLFDSFFGYSIIEDASKIIASSKIESDHYRDVFHDFPYEKVVHLPNSIDLKPYHNLPKKGGFKEKYSLDDSTKILLFLGRIHEIKGLDLLLQAFSEVVKCLRGLKLVIAGPDDGYLSRLRLFVKQLGIEDSVLFLGPLYEKDKLQAYVDADVFVLPSKSESFGNVVLEALACGTPVIVTKNCGVTEYLGSDCGCIIDYNEEQLRTTLIKFLQDTDLKRGCGERGKRLVFKEFDMDKIVGKLEELYRSMLS